MDRWLDPIVFEWRGASQGGSLFEDELWKRAHQIWGHVEDLLSRPTTEHIRANAIMDLRRVIDRRVRMLNDRYALRKLPLKDKPSDTLELLAFMGIVRPQMLQNLIDIRNAVEHEDAEPPDFETCQVFLEFTWYFLKSTDKMVQMVSDSILFELNEAGSGYWIETRFNLPESWIPKILGWVPPDLISSEHKDNWISLKVERTETRSEAILRMKPDEGPDVDVLESYGWGRNEDDIYFSAEMRGPSDALKKLYKIYFDLTG